MSIDNNAVMDTIKAFMELPNDEKALTIGFIKGIEAEKIVIAKKFASPPIVYEHSKKDADVDD